MVKPKVGEIVEVEWMDASANQKDRKYKHKNISASDLLVNTKTYGVLFKEDINAVLIYQEDSTEECDWTAIPRGCILNIKVIK
jgi:hypothetical protein